jgi:hypothetical protein
MGSGGCGAGSVTDTNPRKESLVGYDSQVWKTYGAIMRACSRAWNWFVSDPLRITAIGTREWVIL